MTEINTLFSELMDEMDLLSQSFEAETAPCQSSSDAEAISSMCFNNLNESLHELEECDLDILVAGLVADLSLAEERLTLRSVSPQPAHTPAPPGGHTSAPPHLALEGPSSQLSLQVPTSALSQIEATAQTKAEKIKLALEKLNEAKMKKLIIKVLLSDGSSKALMVDERQTARDVLDNLFEKTHCDCSVDWSLCETNPHLQIERAFEDHECLVEHLSTWSRDTENQLLFLRRSDKYAVFREPQMFYLWKKDGSKMSEKDKGFLIKESFEGPSASVPDLEGALFLKESVKKTWKRRYFILRASGIYYVQKGKTKLSSDLACFIQLEHVNVYHSQEYKHKYRAPTDFCFVLKHPQIQMESEYVRILCCDDERSLSLWVTSIRIAKYGPQLYRNYQTALQRASVSTPGNSQLTRFTTPSTTVLKAAQSNGNHAVTPASSQRDSIPPGPDQTQASEHQTRVQGQPGDQQAVTQRETPSPIHQQLDNDLDDDLVEPPPDFVPPSPPGRRSKSNL
ncbi:amyloid beta A4 precursor protein-binding family B member 1-interacting protein-like isoform X2 [Clupea harengus]|uniref:Amyloid beta A4 precursor protein-binding family B member 1-interacting protein n=1 Tax=Clupea harengus TaxID=7950 RepID=A0A6P8F5D2_CLUHA|nr:amyloid beta A4 precursor protein-binding family B member 1-interacting protein-like isoform X2 [Clupea harengus]